MLSNCLLVLLEKTFHCRHDIAIKKHNQQALVVESFMFRTTGCIGS